MAALLATPTFAEASVKDLEALNVAGLVGPAGMDPNAVAKLHGATHSMPADPRVKADFDKLGLQVVGSSPQEFAALIKQDLDPWAKVVKEVR